MGYPLSMPNINAGAGKNGVPNIFGKGFLAVKTNSMDASSEALISLKADYKNYKIKQFKAGDLVVVSILNDNTLLRIVGNTESKEMLEGMLQKYASILDGTCDFETLKNDSVKRQRNMVKIAVNHSSWLANCFSDFYESHKDDDVCFCIHADTTSNIINRIRLMEDEVGFVYVFPDTRLQFEYELKKYLVNVICTHHFYA